MTDIAKIGFSADTRDLDKAVLTLNKLKNASQGVTSSTNKVTRAVEGSSSTLKKASIEVARAKTLSAKANLELAQSSTNTSKKEMEQARQAYKLAKAEETKTRALIASAKAHASVERAATGQLTTLQRINAITGVTGLGGKSARDSAGVFGGLARDQMPNRFNTANIAAQFQDVGVTAAMGMNPLTIALQQGTQLSAILNSMESPLQGLKVAFTSIINPVSLLSIALIGLVAAGIQLVDWAEVARSGLMFFADAIEVATPYVLGLGAALGVIYAPAILVGLKAVAVGIATIGLTAIVAGAKMATAWIIGMGPIGWVTAGIIAVLGLMNMFRDEMANLFGVDLLQYVKTGVNKIIGVFVGAYNVISDSWSNLPSTIGSLVIEATNMTLTPVRNMVQGIIKLLNEITGMEIEVPSVKIPNPFENILLGNGQTFGEAMSEAMTHDYVGAGAQAVTDFSKGTAEKVREFATGIGSESDKKKKGGKTPAEHYADIISGSERRIAILRAERESLNLTEEASARLRLQTDLLNQAQQKGIELTPVQISELEGLASTMASIEIETRKVKDMMEFSRQTSTGFLSDLRNNLLDGENAWGSFANAASRAIDKILDKQFELLTNDLFGGGGSGGGIGGFIGSLATGLFGGGGGSGGSFNPAVSAPPVKPFANGGVFTNSIANSPTPFMFANGGAFGVMGEVGPEAVMPLQRGSDGSLGVRVNGGNSGNTVINEYNIDARGAEIGVEERIRDELEQLRGEIPAIAVDSVQKVNNRNLGFFE